MTVRPASEAKDLLLEDYRYRAEMMRESEKAGETRVNLFIVLMALVSAALVGLVTGQRPLDKALEFMVLTGALGGLLVFGWLTLLRVVKRNKSTDECKHSMDLIRQLFKDRFDEEGILVGYYPVNWPKCGKKKKKKKKISSQATHAAQVETGPAKATDDPRSFGGLAHLVASINSILVAALCAAILWNPARTALGNVLAASALLFFASLLGQLAYLSSKERKHREELKKLLPTHAGGVVVKQVSGQNQYLLVRPRKNPKNEDIWVLPKGHIEQGEGQGEAALREVKEEAGVIARLLSPLGQWDFTVEMENSEPTEKKVVRMKVYLMAYEEDQAEHERRRVHWSDAKTAIKDAKHSETKAILRKAEREVEIIRRQERSTTATGNE